MNLLTGGTERSSESVGIMFSSLETRAGSRGAFKKGVPYHFSLPSVGPSNDFQRSVVTLSCGVSRFSLFEISSGLKRSNE